MALDEFTNQQKCPREEIFLYLEGELSAAAEMSLERHFIDCEICLAEFNTQKELSRTLNFAFDKQTEVELPKDFTKIVVSKAESKVNGLRNSQERKKAVFVSCALFLILAVGFGAETEKGFAAMSEIGRQMLALAGFIIHSIYDLSVGIGVIIRNLSQKLSLTSVFPVFLFFGILSLVIFIISRLKLKNNSLQN